MNNSTNYLWSAIVVMSLATFATRLIPFILLKKASDLSAMKFIGKYLPPAIMIILVIYCTRGALSESHSHALIELSSVVLTAGIQIWKRNALLSISIGTLFHQLLLR